MIKTFPSLLGVGLLVASLGLPVAASAHDDHDGLALLVRSAVGRVHDDGHHVRYVPHRRHGFVPAWQHLRWQRYYHAPHRRLDHHQHLHWGEGRDNRRHGRHDHYRRDHGDHDRRHH